MPCVEKLTQTKEWSVSVVLIRDKCPYRKWNDGRYMCVFEPVSDGNTFYTCSQGRCKLKVI